MIRIRKSNDRGHANHGWLDTHYSFSFSTYHDPEHMGFRSLRVINEDRVEAGMGFGSHPHNDMEIVTYVVSGKLAHKDSGGNTGTLERGWIQAMSAGSGIVHSEFNGSKSDEVHLLQIWIMPAERGVTPRYADAFISDDEKRDRLRLLVSPDGANGSLPIHQDARIFASLLGEGSEVTHEIADGRHAWVQVVSGAVDVNGESMNAGDGAAISDVKALAIRAAAPAELLLFDLN
ncbi:MAG: pirin family protein [Gemmatimonadetes bacterium]|nr:pirin family protein [Gemmatimonadota bacterium]